MSEEADRPEGWEQVDYSQLQPDIRPVVEARINRLYGQVKESQRVMNQLAADNKTLLDRLGNIEAGMASSQAADFRAQLKEAAEQGDYERVATLTEQRLNATSKPAVETAPQKSEAREETPAPESVDISEHLSAEEEAFVAAWYQERDASGNLLRPWADPNNKDFQSAAEVFNANWNRPSVRQNGVMAVLSEVDRVMGTQKPAQQTAAPVMRNTGRSMPSSSSGKLTAEQKEAAALLGVSEDLYTKEIAAMQSREKAGERAFRKVIDS